MICKANVELATLISSNRKAVTINFIQSQDAAAAVRNALILTSNYLASLLPIINDPFQICIVTYALHLTNHRSCGDAFMIMVAAQRNGIQLNKFTPNVKLV